MLKLATMLLGDDDGEWTPEKIQAQLDSKKTKQANFVKPLPIYIVLSIFLASVVLAFALDAIKLAIFQRLKMI